MPSVLSDFIVKCFYLAAATFYNLYNANIGVE